MKTSKILLFPYWLTLKIRHRLYDKGKLKSYKFDVPVICVGNVTVGGTGKTPMTEMLVDMLSKDKRVAVLSMGYKRHSKGFRIVEPDSSAAFAGDEPLQMKRKYPQATVAVDRNRKRGIESLMALPEPPDVVILDDGFQRREIYPLKNIFLIDSNRPIFHDQLLPLGNLRDLPEQALRADAVVFTKCPEYLDEWDREKICAANRINPTKQKVFFTKISYCQPEAVFKELGNNRYIYAKEVILFTGVANPKPMVAALYDKYEYIEQHSFPDHHNFSRNDIHTLWSYAKRHPLSVLMTTEKDAQRLLHNRHIPEEMKVRLYYLPIKTEFLTWKEMESFSEFLTF